MYWPFPLIVPDNRFVACFPDGRPGEMNPVGQVYGLSPSTKIGSVDLHQCFGNMLLIKRFVFMGYNACIVWAFQK